jgi:hypothetical protein
MKDLTDLAEWDENMIELLVGQDHRIVLHTMHGTVIIDVRHDDVNAFVQTSSGRKDTVLLAGQPEATRKLMELRSQDREEAKHG